MPDRFDAARESLRAHLAKVPNRDEIDRDARKRSEVVYRVAKLKGAELDAVLDDVRVRAPDPELDRLLRKSA